MNVFLVPARDAEGNAKVVPDPDTGAPLQADGENKTLNQFWRRRLRDGDVTEGKPAASKPADAPAAPDKPAKLKG